MTETDKLMALRRKLIAKRRALVESFLTATAEQLTGEMFAKVQNAIDAVDRAIEDEQRQATAGPESSHRAPAAHPRVT